MSRYTTAILKYPTGKYSLCGAVPVDLMTGVEKNYFPIWDTEQQAIDALISVGITTFQLSNCEFYKGVN